MLLTFNEEIQFAIYVNGSAFLFSFEDYATYTDVLANKQRRYKNLRINYFVMTVIKINTQTSTHIQANEQKCSLGKGICIPQSETEINQLILRVW